MHFQETLRERGFEFYYLGKNPLASPEGVCP